MSQRSAGTSRIASRAVAQQLPERLGIVGAAGKAAAHADDGDRRACALLARLDLLVQLEREQRQALGRQFADPVEKVALISRLVPSRGRQAAARPLRPTGPRSSRPGRGAGAAGAVRARRRRQLPARSSRR